MSLLKVQNQLDSLQAQVDALKQIQDLSVRASADGTEYIVVNVSGVDYKMLASTFFATPTVEKAANFDLAVSNKNGRILVTANSVQMTIPTSLGWAKGDYCFVELGGTGFTMSTTGITVNSPATLDDTQYSIYFIVKTDTDVFTIVQLGVSGGGGGSGTVTSVAVSGSDGIQVDSGSPITTSGTIALGLNKATTLTFLNVEDGADVTDATNVDAAGAVMNTDTSTASMSFVVDEDNMVSNSATKVPTQQSVKAYVDGLTGNEFADNVFRIQDNTDATKEVAFEASGITTGTTRTITMPDADVNLANVNSALQNIVEDTTPQLGGELDMNGHSVGGDAQTATGDGTLNIDWRAGNFFHFQFGAFNEVISFTNPTKPGTFILKMVQDSVGSRTVTAWPGSVKWPGGTAPTLTTTATTGTDIITFYFDGTNYFGIDALNFS